MNLNLDTLDLDAKVGALLEQARQVARLDDFGSSDFIAPMKMFLSFDKHFTDAGKAHRWQMIHEILLNRLRVADGIRRNPEILEEDVSDPIIIVGFPRSGTTALQRMMSADPGVQALYTWQTFNPAPFPGEVIGNPAGRIEYARKLESSARDDNPDWFAAHATLSEEAEEDLWLHNLTFRQMGNYVWQPFADYADYIQSIYRLPTYEYTADLYRYLQWQNGGKRGRRWVMKSPNHMGSMDEVLAVHPNAVIVYPVRNYREVIASLCALLETYHTDRFRGLDLHALGKVNLAVWKRELLRFNESRARLGERLKILTMPYQEILSDPMPYIRQAHRIAGGELSATGEAAIQHWRDSNPKGKHGTFTYDLSRYGLTGEEIDNACGIAEA